MKPKSLLKRLARNKLITKAGPISHIQTNASQVLARDNPPSHTRLINNKVQRSRTENRVHVGRRSPVSVSMTSNTFQIRSAGLGERRSKVRRIKMFWLSENIQHSI